MTFLKTVESYRQGARTLPGRYYTAPDVFADEQERIFARHWICIGRDASLAAPGERRPPHRAPRGRSRSRPRVGLMATHPEEDPIMRRNWKALLAVVAVLAVLVAGTTTSFAATKAKKVTITSAFVFTPHIR